MEVTKPLWRWKGTLKETTTPLRESAQRVQDALRALGFENDVFELRESTRTAPDAAAAVGCRTEQIAKSLVFRASLSGRHVLVIASGKNRVSMAKLDALLGESLEKANADFVRDRTGFVIGGVAPIGHRTLPVVFVDQDLLRLDLIWAAAGTPFALFKLTPGELVRMSGGRVADVREDPLNPS